jgi:putative oxidoreductase
MLENVGLPPALAYGAYVGEVLAPLMVIVGFYARIGAALMAINMLFAVGLAHTKDIFVLTGTGAWALELQGFFLACSIAVTLIGPGRYSINRR